MFRQWYIVLRITRILDLSPIKYSFLDYRKLDKVQKLCTILWSTLLLWNQNAHHQILSQNTWIAYKCSHPAYLKSVLSVRYLWFSHWCWCRSKSSRICTVITSVLERCTASICTEQQPKMVQHSRWPRASILTSFSHLCPGLQSDLFPSFICDCVFLINLMHVTRSAHLILLALINLMKLVMHLIQSTHTVTEWISPPWGRKEENRTIRSLALILSQSMWHTANRFVASSVLAASLSSSPHPWSNSSSSDPANNKTL